MNNIHNALMTDEDWINQGKADAWEGKPKQTPEHDPQAASMYDLGYCEGEIERSPLKEKINLSDGKSPSRKRVGYIEPKASTHDVFSGGTGRMNI